MNGRLIVNADDWGRDRRTTDCILECTRRGTVSAVSAMVFMEDSERAADIALREGIDAGLHLNFTDSFTAPCPPVLADYQRRTARHLKRHRLAPTVFNPALVTSFDYAVKAQIEEYRRLYGRDPHRIDGHHHMHLCANVILQGLLPSGTRIRRNFVFQAGEKGLLNRVYRRALDGWLSRRHDLADYLFALVPLEPRERLDRIFMLAKEHVVEIETHPVVPDEYRFLTGDDVLLRAGGINIAPHIVRSRF